MKFDAENSPKVQKGTKKARRNRLIIVSGAIILAIPLLIFGFYENKNETVTHSTEYNVELYDHSDITKIDEIQKIRSLIPFQLKNVYSKYMLDYFDITNVKTEQIEFGDASIESEYLLYLKSEYEDVSSMQKLLEESSSHLETLKVHDAVAESYRIDVISYLETLETNLEVTSDLINKNADITVDDLLNETKLIDSWDDNFIAYNYLFNQVDLSTNKGLLKYYRKAELEQEAKNFLTVLNGADSSTSTELYIDSKSSMERFLSNLKQYKEIGNLSKTELDFIKKAEELFHQVDSYYRYLNALESNENIDLLEDNAKGNYINQIQKLENEITQLINEM